VQGMSFLAAVTLLVCQEEEAAFWLFAHLAEEVLSPGFFCSSPYILGYHADTAIFQDLVQKIFPELTTALGAEGLKEALSLLTVKWFVTCFLDYLPVEPLLVLWDRLFLSSRSDRPLKPARQDASAGEAPQLPLYTFGLAIIQLHLKELLQMAAMGELDVISAYQFLLKSAATMPPPRFKTLLEEASRIESQLIVTGIAQRHLEERQAYQANYEIQLLATGGMTRFTQDQLRCLRDEFQVLATTSSEPPPHPMRRPSRRSSFFCTSEDQYELELTQSEFEKVVARVASGWPEHCTAQLFRLMDKDASGALSFEELMVGLSVLCLGSVTDKLRLVFELYDTDASGMLEEDEILAMVTVLFKLTEQGTGSAGCPTQENRAVPAFKRVNLIKADINLSRSMSAIDGLVIDAVVDPDQPLGEGPVRRESERAQSLPDLRFWELDGQGLTKKLLRMDIDDDQRLSLDEWCQGVLTEPRLLKLLQVSSAEEVTLLTPEECAVSRQPVHTEFTDLWQPGTGNEDEGKQSCTCCVVG